MGCEFVLSLMILLHVSDSDSQNSEIPLVKTVSTVLSTVTGLLFSSDGGERELPNYPAGLSPPEKIIHESWSTERRVNNVLRIVAKTPSDVVIIANYARSLGMNVRVVGFKHNWSPLTVVNSNTSKNIILVDLRVNLKRMEMTSTDSKSSSVMVETGASMENLLTFLEDHEKGLFAFPAPGDITVGGALAINGHGTGIPAIREFPKRGHTYGTLSNLIISFTAVVWNPQLSSFALRTFYRNETDSKGFLTNLGRTVLTQVELRVGPNYNLRCVSHVDIPSSELFAHPSSVTRETRTFSKFLDSHGRVETILFPWTKNPWLKVWSVSPDKPADSREVKSPFNYLFSDNVPPLVTRLYGLIQSGLTLLTPTLGQLQYTLTAEGLAATNTYDIWGPSKNLLLYIKPTTLRVTANGYAILTTRSNIQRVISHFYSYYENLMSEFAKKGQFPANGPMEIRVTGLDNHEDVNIPGAQSPTLSAVRPDHLHPEFDVTIWLDILSFPNTPFSSAFMLKIESFIMDNFHARGCTVRPEWSKGWAYTSEEAWKNTQFIQDFIPKVFRARSSRDGWSWAKSNFRKYDPHQVFSNEFLNQIFH